MGFVLGMKAPIASLFLSHIPVFGPLVVTVVVILIAAAFWTVIEDWINAKKKDPSISLLNQATKGRDEPHEPSRWVP